MRKLIVAFSGALLVGGFLGMARTESNPCHGHSDRAGDRCGKGALSSIPLLNSYVFNQPGQYPPCTVAENCLALCTVASNGNWGCTRSDGGSFGTIAQGTSPTTIQTIFSGAYARQDITDTSAATVTADGELTTFFGSDHTIVAAGYGTTKTNATFQHWLGYSDGTHIFYARGDNGDRFGCAYSNGAASAIANVAGLPIDGWAVASCRKSGTTYTARVNGTDQAVTDSDTTGTHNNGTVLYLGTRTPATLPLRGPLAFVALYLEGKSAAWMTGVEQRWWGSYPVGGHVGQARGMLHPDGGGDFYFTGAAMADERGLRLQDGPFTNKWAADPLAAATWTDVGTSTVTSNATAGPFFKWRNTNECDLIEDDDNAAFEGRASASAGTAASMYNASCVVAAGTSGTTTTKARLAWVTDGNLDAGSGTGVCDFTGLTSAPQRVACEAYVGGTPTSVVAQLLVGNAAAETGSVTACHCQLTATTVAQEPTLNNVLQGGTIAVLDGGGGLPSGAANGAFEIVYSSPYRVPEDLHSTEDTFYALDAYNDTDIDAGDGTLLTHSAFIIHGYNTQPWQSLVDVRNGVASGPSFAPDASIALTTRYVSRVEWRLAAGGKCNVWYKHNTCPANGTTASCVATTIIASSTNATATCPSQARLIRAMSRMGNLFLTDGFVEAIRTYGS